MASIMKLTKLDLKSSIHVTILHYLPQDLIHDMRPPSPTYGPRNGFLYMVQAQLAYVTLSPMVAAFVWPYAPISAIRPNRWKRRSRERKPTHVRRTSRNVRLSVPKAVWKKQPR